MVVSETWAISVRMVGSLDIGRRLLVFIDLSAPARSGQGSTTMLSGFPGILRLLISFTRLRSVVHRNEAS